MTDELLGPYAVTSTQVGALGQSFTPLVNALLRAEVAVAGLSSVAITTTDIENIGDRGVDVGITRAVESRHIPAGESAWQFKRGDLAPAKSKQELRGATQAQEVLRSGGRYRLVLGADLNDLKVRNRRKALLEEANALGIALASDDAIEVLTASDLAEWIELHPSLAVSNLLGGVRGAVEDFDEWSGSDGAATQYVESDARKRTVKVIQDFVVGSESCAMRVEGVSGLGKSRIVLEALRGEPYEAIVIYIREADKFPASLIRYLTGEGRTAILVVDECDARTHKNLAAAMPQGSRSRLITIGELEPSRSEGRPTALPPMESHTLAEVVRLNRPAIGPESASFVAEIADGNVRLALVLADAVAQSPDVIAARLINIDLIKAYVTESLPIGTDFMASAALALLTRVGVADDVAGELSLLADGLGLPLVQLRAALRTLTELGLLSRKGRYRSVTPQPLAVYLATRAWEDFGDQIVDDLMPTLQAPLLALLVERAAEIGPSAAVVRLAYVLIGRADILGSLNALEEGEHLGLVRSLAILVPQAMMTALSTMLEGATDEQLVGANRSRRTLVRSLEALAWHSATFEVAADALLRLALTETEDFTNNATGAWCALFGVMLPNTAASPTTRLDYLKRAATSADVRLRRLAAKAAAGLLQSHETSFSSGERQLGVMVEPRGRPLTWADVWDYQREGINLVRQFVDDSDVEIAKAAIAALVRAIHPFLEYEPVRDDLIRALASLPGPGLRQVRTEVSHLEALFDRVSGVEGRRVGLELLEAALPKQNPDDRLRSLLQTRRWDFDDENELQRRITEAVTELLKTESVASLLAVFDEDRWEASFELGNSLSQLVPSQEVEDRLVTLVDQPNSPGLTGYLQGLVAGGRASAFDDFLDGPHGTAMPAGDRLFLTVRGPKSTRGWDRVNELLPSMPVQAGAVGLFGWHIDFNTDQLNTTLIDWLPRIASQADYTAAVDFVAMALYRRDAPAGAVESRVVELVELRRLYPDVGQQSHDWTRLAQRRLASAPAELWTSLIDLVHAGGLHMFEHSEELKLAQEALKQVGMSAWDQVMSKLDDDNWRLQMDLRGWFADAMPGDEVVTWIGDDVTRARTAVTLVGISDGAPSAVVRHLLEHFGDDPAISDWLISDFVTGSWMGNESDRLQRQIDQLQAWVDDVDEPEGLRRWARKLIASLKKSREAALRREAEGDW
ncbi:hypothetical protein ACSMXN_22780 [Jatrophihabitans sp. DSM 45814]